MLLGAAFKQGVERRERSLATWEECFAELIDFKEKSRAVCCR